MSGIPEEARLILEGAATAYDESSVSARGTGPWPVPGDHDVLFKRFEVAVADFNYKSQAGEYETMENGLRLQLVYANMDDNGDEAEWKGAIVNLPPNFAEVIQTLPKLKGLNCQKAIQAGLGRLKGACQYILGRPASSSLITDIEEANAVAEAEIVGLVVNVVARPYTTVKGEDKIDHTDYVNGTVDVSEVAPATSDTAPSTT